jgi:hypothetical protein
MAGALKLLERNHPLLFMEIHPLAIGGFGYSVRKIVEMLPPGYDFNFYYYDDSHPNMFARFFSRYFKRAPCHYDLPEVEKLIEQKPGITQIFMLATPQKPRG